MKKILITIGIILSVIILLIGGFVLVLSNGFEATQRLTIGAIDASSISDGIYEGEYDGGRFTNKVEVTVESGRITGIEALKTVMFENEDVTRQLIGDVITAQNTDVDTVSGATVTTKAYLKSIENALVQK